MSSQASATPQLVIDLAKLAVYNEKTHAEVATAATGNLTESFGPMQIVLHHPHVITHLHAGEAYDVRSGTPHADHKNMHYVGKTTGGDLLFRAPTP